MLESDILSQSMDRAAFCLEALVENPFSFLSHNLEAIFSFWSTSLHWKPKNYSICHYLWHWLWISPCLPLKGIPDCSRPILYFKIILLFVGYSFGDTLLCSGLFLASALRIIPGGFMRSYKLPSIKLAHSYARSIYLLHLSHPI